MPKNLESTKPFQSLKLNVRQKDSDVSKLPKKGSDAATTIPGKPKVTLESGSDIYHPEESNNIFRTNMVTSKNGGLIMLTQSDLTPTAGDITVWDDSARDIWNHTKAAEKFVIQTKDYDFSGNDTTKAFSGPSRKKKIYKVYITFRSNSYTSGVKLNYATNGSTTFSGTFSDTTYYSDTKGFDAYNAGSPSSDWITVGLKPSSSISDVHSFALKFSFANAGHIGQLQAANTVGQNTVTLKSSASSTDDFYNGMPIFFYSGLGYGQIRKIIDYNGSTKVATLSSQLNADVSATTLYDLGYIHSSFEINDISIIYREKAIK